MIENELKHYSSTNIANRNFKYNPNKIIDFSTYYKHLTLTDNEYLYYKRVGNPVEFAECKFTDLFPETTGRPLTKIHQKVNKKELDYITVSKNVKIKY